MTHVYIEQCRLSNGLVVRSDSRTPLEALYREVYKNCVYTPPGFEIKPKDVVVDLGANIGVFSLFAASVSSTVHVHAIEPSSRSFALLQQNVEVNNLSNVRCYRCSVSARTGKQVLYVAGTGSTADTMVPSRVPSQGALKHRVC